MNPESSEDLKLLLFGTIAILSTVFVLILAVLLSNQPEICPTPSPVQSSRSSLLFSTHPFTIA